MKEKKEHLITVKELIDKGACEEGMKDFVVRFEETAFDPGVPPREVREWALTQRTSDYADWIEDHYKEYLKPKGPSMDPEDYVVANITGNRITLYDKVNRFYLVSVTENGTLVRPLGIPLGVYSTDSEGRIELDETD